MSFTRKTCVLAIGAALLAAGCGDDDAEQPASAREPTPTQTAAATPDTGGEPVTAADFTGISEDLDTEPQVTVPEGGPPEQLITKDIVKGKGKKIQPGDMIAVQYTGVLLNGEKFDASWDRGAEPLTLQIGAGQVIPGWDQGIPGMREGGRRLLVIPSELAYGAQGSPPVIGPDEPLIFVVDAVNVA